MNTEAHDQDFSSAIAILYDRLEKLEKRNGDDHHVFRDNMHDLELKYAEQKGHLASIMSVLTELKTDTRQIIDRLNDSSTKIATITDINKKVKTLEDEVDEIHKKPLKTLESIKGQVITFVIGIVLLIIAVVLGLERFV